MTTTSPSTALSDLAVSHLRTAVPVLWGSLLATLLRLITPHLPGDVAAALADLLGSELALTLVTAAAIAAWYAAWRWAEPRIPDWLTRLVIGSARAPGYALTPATVSSDGVATITTLGADERTNLAQLRDALDEGDPGRTALERVLTT